MTKDKGDWYWDPRRKGYVLHAFDKLFRRGDGELRFHHYKAAIVINGGRPIWLYENKDFEALIQIIRNAQRACLRGPVVKEAKTTKDAFRQLKKRRKR